MYKINVFLILLINFMYVFRSIMVAFKIENMIYFLTAFVVIFNFLFRLANLKEVKVHNVTVFICIGLIVLLYSFLINSAIVGMIGFLVIFLNLIFWDSFIKNIPEGKFMVFFQLYIKANVLFAIITAISGIYQYFLDPSLMGLALHEIYGNTELMESGRFVRRATGFMGSPQNYALYIGLMTCLLYYSGIAKKKTAYLILFAGGLVSGSRAYILFIMQVVILVVLLNGILSAKKTENIIKNGILLISIMILIFGVVKLGFSNKTLARMTKFISDWPALYIYKEHLRSMNFITFWFGKGLGINERIVVNLLGHRYYDMVDSYTVSYESYVLSIFMQSGIVGIISFLSIYIRALKSAFRFKNKLYFSILTAIFINLLFTPSFNGLAMSYIIWPLILFPYYVKSEYLCELAERSNQIRCIK